MKISHIVAVDSNWGIGKNNTIPWHLPADLRYFKQKTMGHHMLLGRKNFESIGKALPGRVSIIVTRQANFEVADCITVHTIQDGINIAEKAGEQELFIVGGGEIYAQTLDLVSCIYLTRLHIDAEADTFYPALNNEDWILMESVSGILDEKNTIPHVYECWCRKK